MQTVTLPFHGSAKRYTLAGGAQAVATLYSNRDTATTNPAVVRFGNTATWSYDLARSVAYARQGDPANAGVDDDGLPGLRTIDVFFDEIDKDRVRWPHADIQMRLFGRLIGDLLADQFPMPRFWYFPNGNRTQLDPDLGRARQSSEPVRPDGLRHPGQERAHVNLSEPL